MGCFTAGRARDAGHTCVLCIDRCDARIGLQ